MSGFGKHSGPTSAPKSANPFQFQRPPPPTSTPQIRPSRVNEAVDSVRSPSAPVENFSHAPRPYKYGGVQRPIVSPPGWDDGNISLLDYDAQTHLGPPTITSFIASRNSGTSVTAKVARFQESKRTRSPPLVSTDDSLPKNSSQMILQRPSFHPQMPHNPVKFPATYSKFPALQDRSVVSPHLDSPDYRKNFVTEVPDIQAPKQGKLLSEQFDGQFSQEHPMFVRNGTKGPSGSPPRFGTKSVSPSSSVPIRPRPLPSARNDPSPAVRNSGPSNSKRTRSPIYSDEFLQDNSTRIEGDTQRSPPSIYRDEFLQDNSTANVPIRSRTLPSASNDPSPPVRNILVSKRTRSPPSIYDDAFLQDNSTPTEDDTQRLPPSLYRDEFLQENSTPNVPIRPRSLPSVRNDPSPAVRNFGSSSVTKRTRSPPIYRDEFLQDNSTPIEDDAERELQAKAKRAARFRTELSEPVQKNPPDIADQRLSATRFQQSVEERKKHVGEQSMDSSGELLNDAILSDFDGTEASRAIIGLCPDMCPESERGERERKGDLDLYERLDGDRNQTSEFLAVKKYTRTAEREACLIRPMPVLQKTMDYLLNLLDQPYDERFLGIYNFLWDRMRAIRMDLRMQHIFDQGAITMLEQMIRLHIIAMHELCEYTKGEGFSEGFDAHLNIEQMNKTSVELFQMYDDHRKKGINVPTEKEFRGYYALLKLDKHPGYKVEPAELSLDLAKMTPEIRQTSEVLFARDVARACRTGNYVAFFRLARRASYLQTCLMHAHFAKLRTQAFASLHSSLQNNQGLPVTLVAKWLGIEEEDIESILDYYGFSIKDFEEPYMVKDGSFLNAENDYPTKCSRLVHQKRSRAIVADVAAPHEATSLPIGASKESQQGKAYKQRAEASPSPKRKSSILAVDQEMTDSKVVPSPKSSLQLHSVTETSKWSQQFQDGHINSGASKPFNFSLDHTSPRSLPAKVKEKANALFTISQDRVIASGIKETPLQINSLPSQSEISPRGIFDLTAENSTPQSMAIDNVKSLPLRSPSGKYTKNSIPQATAISDIESQSERPSVKYDYALENSVPQGMEVNDLGDKHPDSHQEIENQEIVENIQQKEVAEAKLKLFLRLWGRRAAKQRELREQRQLAAEAALSSLPLGIPVRQNNNQRSTFGELDFDHVMRERGEKYESSWSRLNVSDVVSGILVQRNPDAKCLCWKIVLCFPESKQGDQLSRKSQADHLAAGSWLFTKIMPFTEDNNDDDLAITSPGLSIWKKWVPSVSGTDLTCCLSVVKDANCDNLDEAVSGASAVLFNVSYSIPWNLQKTQLYNILNLVPPGARLPLLVLSGSYNVGGSDLSSLIVHELGLHDIDRSRISSFLVVFLAGKQHSEHSNGFYSDEKLREGLKWLANESPLQPVLSIVKTRELVMSHMSPVLEVLDKMSDYEVGPNHCISVFNEALDWSLGEISAAVKANPTNWPCPETMLLKDSSDELLSVKLFLPSVGWNSARKTAPIEYALRDCRLPRFPDDITLLQNGSKMGKDIDNHRLLLENFLTGYLTQSTKIMGIQLATKETSVMLQRNTRLELRNLSYYLVPNWITIFRRIFNWRLSSLSTGAASFSYVLQSHHVPPMSRGSLEKQREVVTSPYCSSHYPSLDEIIEVGCSPLKSRRISFDPEPSPVETVFHTVVREAVMTDEEEEDLLQKDGLAIADDDGCTTNKPNSSYGGTLIAAGTETDRLSQLLETCNIVQNSIGEKLSIYF